MLPGKTVIVLVVVTALTLLWPLLPAVAQTPTTLSFEEQVIALTNQERYSHGLPPLQANQYLAQAALAHSRAMANEGFFDHRNPRDNSEVGVRAERAGYNWTFIGENIALGSPTPQRVVARWMNSPGHRGNILDSDFTEIGVGYIATGRDAASCRPSMCRHFWTQVFGQRQDSAIPGGSRGGRATAGPAASPTSSTTTPARPTTSPTGPAPSSRPTGLTQPWEAPLQMLGALCGCWCLAPLLVMAAAVILIILRTRQR
jgi:uncharacterized protein YkwD